MSEIAGEAAEGLRERKKRATRTAIADAARRLFIERGYDGVTVAQVARAADVSEKTVYNHFPTKEDLAFAGGEQRIEALVAAVRDRPDGTSVLDAFRAATERVLDHIETAPVDEILAMPRMVRNSTTLRDRLLLGWEEEAAALAPVVAEAAGLEAGDLVAAVVARTLAWTNRLVVRAAFTRLLAGDDQRAVAAELRVEARRAYDRLGEGLAGYGA